MGKIRIFKKAVRFTIRSRKRFLVFTLIFAIISTFIAFYVDSLDDLQTDRFLEQKGVIMRQSGEKQVTYNEATSIINDILNLPLGNSDVEIEDHAAYYYTDLDPLIRVYSMDISKPWYSDFVKPSLVQDGNYPKKDNEVLIPHGTLQVSSTNITGLNIKSKIAVGQEFTFERPGFNDIDIKVSGTFDTSKLQQRSDPNKLWLFVDFDVFEDLIAMFGQQLTDTFAYGISWVVPGNAIFSSDIYKKVENLNDVIKPMLDDVASYGSWEEQPNVLPSQKAVDAASRTRVNLGFVVIGGIVLATMFAYLVSRFRRREIAILKAMGYSHGSVRTSLIAEILTISFAGFIIGLSSAQGLLYYFSEFNRNTLLRWEAGLVSFLINVIITLPGMLLVSRRVLGVSPSEAFRDR